MDLKESKHIVEYEQDGVMKQYEFSSYSKDVEFRGYKTNKVISTDPYTELVEEKWYIKSLDKEIVLKRTTKYFGELAKRRQWEQYGNNNDNSASVGEDVFMEWNPEILRNKSVLRQVEKYYYSGGNNNNDPRDIIYFNQNISTNYVNNYLSPAIQYQDLIKNVNKLSDNKIKNIKTLARKTLLPIPRNDNQNHITKSTVNHRHMKTIAQSNTSSSNDGMFVPVHLRKGYKSNRNSRNNTRPGSACSTNSDKSNDSSDTKTRDTQNNHNNKRLFQVPRRNQHQHQHQKRYTFVFKGLPNPDDLTNEIILNIVYKHSYTFREIKDPRMCSVFILKDKNTGKNKNMCLVHFKKEDVKNTVLEELLSQRITHDHVIIHVEDGKNN